MFDKIKQDVECVMERDPAARNIFEVLTTCPGVWAVILHRFNHGIWNFGLKWLARWLSTFVRWITGIEIHPGATVGERFFIDHGMGIVIGETTEIGHDCSIYHGVTLGGTSWDKGKRHPTLENNVVIGAGAKILGPIILGAGSRIGSNAVVVKDVPPGSTVVGIPGKVVAKAPPEVKPHIKDFAEKIGFEAYGVSQDMPDPVVNAIDRMLDHIQAMEKQMQSMCKVIKDMGGEVELKDMPELEVACEIKPGEFDDDCEKESRKKLKADHIN